LMVKVIPKIKAIKKTVTMNSRGVRRIECIIL